MTHKNKKQRGYVPYLRYVRPEWKVKLDITLKELELEELKGGVEIEPVNKDDNSLYRVYEIIKRYEASKGVPMTRGLIMDATRSLDRKVVDNILIKLVKEGKLVRNERHYNSRVFYIYST